MIKGTLLIASAAMVTAFLTCADLGGGIGHEGEARISGQLLLSDGVPAAQTRVALFPEKYDPVKNSRPIPRVITDALGNYRFTNVSLGCYMVMAVNDNRKTSTLINDICVTQNEVTIPAHTLQAAGTMKVFLPSGATGYVFVPGTILYAPVINNIDFVVIDSVPAGIVPEVAYSSPNDQSSYTIRYNVPVPSNDTAIVRNPGWKYAGRILLNTSSSGAGVSGNVVHFPVCIRIFPENFDFNQTKAGGADIRFAKMDDTPLPYEIERWDEKGQRAEMWVRADTVFGNNNVQTIMMYWGNAAALDASNKTGVFDTSEGFQGVWHLSESGNADARDATGNRCDGHAFHMSGASPVEGAIGIARDFDGDSSYIAMTNTASGKLNFPENGYFTVSAWVCADTLDNANTSNYTYHTIVAKGHQQYFLQLTTFPSYKPVWEFSNFRETSKWNMSTSPAIEKQWVLLTGVLQGSSQYLYCNGELVANTTTNYSQNASRDTSDDFAIGRFFKEAGIPIFDYCYFKGKIDEVRVSSVARNPDWIRLCFMNQRSEDRLVQFK